MITALGLCTATMLTATAGAQAKRSGAENSLVGVRLFDSGTKVVSMFGSPDEIQAVAVGGQGTGGGGGVGGPGGFGGGAPGGFGGPRGGGGFPGAGGGGRIGGGGGNSPALDINSPFGFGNDVLRQLGGRGAPGAPGVPGGFPGGPPGGIPGGPPGGFPGGAPGGFPGGPPGGFPGAGGGRGGGGFPGGGGGGGAAPQNAERATYTRWVYNRNNSKYGFIIDRYGRVVQIEAIGLNNGRVRTKKGVGFGATFATIVKRYGAPEGYDIAGDSIMLRYLTRNKVAFRLSRLQTAKPHVVTGVVVAAGKG